MKFAALVATAAALRTPNLQNMSCPECNKPQLSFAQMMSAIGGEDTDIEEVFNWYDRDGSGTIDVYEFIFGIGWICGYL